jgi:hypothetical protein
MWVGTGAFLVSVLAVLGLVWAFQKLALAAYPYYANFYGCNFYNAGYYLISIAGIGMLVFSVVFGKAVQRYSVHSIFAGALLTLVLLVIAVKSLVATGAYILYIPLIPALCISTVLFLLHADTYINLFWYTASQMLLLVLPIGLWAPMVYALFIVFSLNMPFAAALFLCLFLPFVIPAAQLIAAVTQA